MYTNRYNFLLIREVDEQIHPLLNLLLASILQP